MQIPAVSSKSGLLLAAAIALSGCGGHKPDTAASNPAQAQAIIQQAQQNAAKQATAYNNHTLPGAQPPAASQYTGHP